MKLLILSHNPDRASFRQRIGVYLPQLQAAGAACKVVKFPDRYLARWALFRQARQYDAVLLHKKTLNLWDAPILRKYARKIIYDFDDAVMVSPKKPDCQHSSHKRLFERTAKLADCVIAGNSYLADYARRFCGNVHILPTGLDTQKYQKVSKPASDGKIRLVWIGSKATLGYLKGLAEALEKIGQMYPNVILRIICDAFFELKALPVEPKRWSQETEAADLAACDIGLCPLPDDPYTRGKCGFKILQYFAAGLPSVASPVGYNKDLVIDRKTGLLASSTEEWFSALRELIDNTLLRNQMGQAGKTIAQNHDTRILGEQLVKIIMGSR